METLSLKCDRCEKERPHVQFVVTHNNGVRTRVTICGKCGHTTKLEMVSDRFGNREELLVRKLFGDGR